MYHEQSKTGLMQYVWPTLRSGFASGHRVALVVVHRTQKSVPDTAREWPTFSPPPLESCSGTANVDGPNWFYNLMHGQQKHILGFFVWKFGFWPGEVMEKSLNFFLRFLWEPWLWFRWALSNRVPSSCPVRRIARQDPLRTTGWESLTNGWYTIILKDKVKA